ncbi:hypothetical protein QMZ05_24535 [Bradyrhizobium sp. INPA03-11B]|uniref:hypothetical protein n=1 Tax=Bradyrhizobium sp. INPA03-11B TaxID=418598 RepID=UPI00338F3E45
MSDTDVIERDRKGRFVTGSNGGPGRKPGSRNLLSTQFLDDLRTVWDESGIEALRRCATEEPAQFVRVVAGLLPKDIHLDVTHGLNPDSFVQTFRAAQAMLGNEPSPPLRQPVPRVIEHD